MIKKLSIITVSFNSDKFIRNYVESVLKYLPKNSEVIILDNNSSDGTALILEEYSSKIKLIRSKINLGFSKGNNRVAKEALGEYLFFLNPDTEVLEPIFDELINFYQNTGDAGIVAPKLVMVNGETQESVKNLPTILRAINEFIFGSKHSYTQYAPVSNEPLKVESVYGAAMLIKTDLFWRVGGFNEKFFMYYEDLDLCEKIRKIGKEIYYFPQVSIKHLVGASESKRNRYELNFESFVKYHGFFKSLIYQLIFLVPRIKRKLSI